MAPSNVPHTYATLPQQIMLIDPTTTMEITMHPGVTEWQDASFFDDDRGSDRVSYWQDVRTAFWVKNFDNGHQRAGGELDATE